MLLLQKSKESLLAILDIVKVKVSLGLRKHICLSPHTHLGSGPSSNLQMFDLVSHDLVQRGERGRALTPLLNLVFPQISPLPSPECGGWGPIKQIQTPSRPHSKHPPPSPSPSPSPDRQGRYSNSSTMNQVLTAQVV